jgi:hypothetical protein
MPVAVVVAYILMEQQEPAVLAVAAMVKQMQEPLLSLELQIPEVGVAVLELLVLRSLLKRVVQAVLASSSLRPINNEDAWKPKSIGCMESTPQCTC